LRKKKPIFKTPKNRAQNKALWPKCPKRAPKKIRGSKKEEPQKGAHNKG